MSAPFDDLVAYANAETERANAAETAREALRAERDEAWKVAAQRRNEARRYYVAWQVARMRARALRTLPTGDAR